MGDCKPDSPWASLRIYQSFGTNPYAALLQLLHTKFPSLRPSPTVSVAPKNRPYSHLQDLWIWQCTCRLGGRTRFVRPFPRPILGILLQWNRGSRARSTWKSSGQLAPGNPVGQLLAPPFWCAWRFTFISWPQSWWWGWTHGCDASTWLNGWDSFAWPIKSSGHHHPACLAITQYFVPGPCRQRVHWVRDHRFHQAFHLWVLSLWTMMASPTWQHTWQSWPTFLLNIVQRLPKFRTCHLDNCA